MLPSGPVLIKRYHPRIPPVQAPVLIASTAPVSGSTGTVLRPFLMSDWPEWKNLLALASPRLGRLIRASLESRRSSLGLANARRFYHTGFQSLPYLYVIYLYIYIYAAKFGYQLNLFLRHQVFKISRFNKFFPKIVNRIISGFE